MTRASNEHFSECFNTSPTFSVKDKNTLLLVKSLQYSIECIPNSDSTTPESTDCRCHNTSQRFGKNCMAYLSWLVLTSLSFYELVWENLWLGEKFRLLSYFAFVFKHRCHKLAILSKWSQMIPLDFLLVTGTLEQESLTPKCSEWSFDLADRRVGKLQGAFRWCQYYVTLNES